MKKEYNIGDEVWFIYFGVNILVKCKITAKLEYNSESVYCIDEPIGHILYVETLFDNFDEAKDELLLCTEYECLDLDTVRKSRMKFIVFTWKNAPESEKSKLFPDKKHKQDWFSLKDLKNE